MMLQTFVLFVVAFLVVTAAMQVGMWLLVPPEPVQIEIEFICPAACTPNGTSQDPNPMYCDCKPDIRGVIVGGL